MKEAVIGKQEAGAVEVRQGKQKARIEDNGREARNKQKQ